MYLARFWNSIIKEDGFIIIDADKKKYIIGSPKKKVPIILKLLDGVKQASGGWTVSP